MDQRRSGLSWTRGASGTVLDASHAKLLGIKVSGDGDVEGTGENSAAAGMAKDVSFSLKGLDFQAREIAVLPLSNLNHYCRARD